MRVSYPLAGDRLLTVVPLNDARSVISTHAVRPIVSLLTAGTDTGTIEAAIVSLIEAACRHFVCVGPSSEALHDRIDDLLVVHAPNSNTLTTWHEDEPIGDVLDYFLNVAGVMRGALLVAIVGVDETELAEALVRKATE